MTSTHCPEDGLQDTVRTVRYRLPLDLRSALPADYRAGGIVKRERKNLN